MKKILSTALLIALATFGFAFTAEAKCNAACPQKKCTTKTCTPVKKNLKATKTCTPVCKNQKASKVCPKTNLPCTGTQKRNCK